MNSSENAFTLRDAGSGAMQHSEKEEAPGGISADWLKVIAMAAMVTDHVGAALLPQITVLRLIGRIAFPIYIWLLVQGFAHTRNRKKYMLRMAGCALLSEVPFDLAFSDRMTFRWQNVYFSLLWGLVLLTVLERLLDAAAVRRQDARTQRCSPVGEACDGKRGIPAVPILLTLVLFMIPAEVLHFDYGFTGPVLVTVFYLHHKIGRPDPAAGFWLFSFSNLLSPLFDILETGGVGFRLLLETAVWESALGTVLIECFGVLAIPFIRRCNGVRRWKRGKTFFYLFYPVHLLILYFIRRLLQFAAMG